MRVYIGGIVHETNTYAPGRTVLGDFHVYRGDEVLQHAKGTRTFVAGMLDAADEIGAEGVPGLYAEVEPSGTIAADAYASLKDELVRTVRATAPDVVALALHGAAIAESTDDLEADLCEAVREAVGPDVPIVCSFDLHGNISQRMCDVIQGAFGDHFYPHTDMYERGHEAVSFAPRVLDGSVRPVLHVETLPILLPTTNTMHGPLVEVNELCWELERRPGVLDVTLFHGFPYTDIARPTAAVVVTTDGDAELARSCGADVGRYLWSIRDDLLPTTSSAAEAIEQALQIEGRPVVINETSDNSGGGAPGGGTHLLRALLDAGVEEACFGFLVDPTAAEAAHRAGVGSVIEVTLGSATDELHGGPLPVTAYVKALTDGQIVLRAFAAGMAFDLGPMARLQVGGVDLIVGSKRSQTFDSELFLLNGIDVSRYRLVALKSSQHFRAAFEEIAAAIVTADPPGLTTLNLHALPRTNLAVPAWPLDASAEYVPSSSTVATG